MKFKVDKETSPFFSVNQFLDIRDKQTPDYIHLINLTLLSQKLTEFRKVLGRMDITSGFRGKEWNSSSTVQGDKNSYHLQGMAADFERKNDKGYEDWGKWTPEDLFAVANYLGFGNIGVYMSVKTKKILWVHVDIGKPWPDNGYDWRRYSDTMSCRTVWRP